MSQVVSCSRCGRASEVRCDLCPDMTPLCRECVTPHYRLFHDMDFHTRTQLPPLQPVQQSVTLMPIPMQVLARNLKKKGRKRSPQRLVSDYIKKMKQP